MKTIYMKCFKKYFTITQCTIDSVNEYTTIATGHTEVECMQNALINLNRVFERTQEELKEIGRRLNAEEFYLSEEFELKDVEVAEIEKLKLEEGYLEYSYKVLYDKESNEYGFTFQ